MICNISSTFLPDGFLTIRMPSSIRFHLTQGVVMVCANHRLLSNDLDCYMVYRNCVSAQHFSNGKFPSGFSFSFSICGDIQQSPCLFAHFIFTFSFHCANFSLNTNIYIFAHELYCYAIVFAFVAISSGSFEVATNEKKSR